MNDRTRAKELAKTKSMKQGKVFCTHGHRYVEP